MKLKFEFNTKGLLEPQVPHAKKLADSIFFNGVAWDGSETGTGKTYAGAAVARAFKGPIVVVGPKIILKKWKEILNQFGREAVVYINYEKLCRGNTPWLKYKSPEKPLTEDELKELAELEGQARSQENGNGNGNILEVAPLLPPQLEPALE